MYPTDPMRQAGAKATIEARLAWAEERRRARRIEQERRAARRRRRRLAVARWWRSRARRTPVVDAPTVAVAVTPLRTPSEELARILQSAAHHVIDCGTSSESLLVEAMSEVAARTAPGAAAALRDPDGSEAARLRAFGFVHTHLMETLGPREHASVLALLTDDGGLQHAGRVA